jgi:hypothetical protein
MHKHLGTSSAAQYLDGTRLTGRLQNPRSTLSTPAPMGAQGPVTDVGSFQPLSFGAPALVPMPLSHRAAVFVNAA